MKMMSNVQTFMFEKGLSFSFRITTGSLAYPKSVMFFHRLLKVCTSTLHINSIET